MYMKTNLRSLAVALCLGLTPGVAVLFSGCAGSQSERSTGQYIDDKALSSRVRSALSDNQEYKFDDVQVTSYRSVVQLSGFVSTSNQKQKAGEIAKAVSGAKSVENNITLKNTVQSSR
jgi:hyperosmotically inducible protein